MSVQVKLIIDEKEINVLWFSFGFNQVADANNRPSQKPVFVGLKLIIETQKNLNLAGWSFAANETKQLELHIYPVIMGGKTRKLYFYDCHLVNWINSFSSIGNQPMSETLEITAAGVKESNSSTEYSAYWRTTFPSNNVEATTINNNEKKITNYYLTNTDGEQIDDYKKDDIIILNIETLNRIGDSLTIDLNDAEYDFEHNGTLIPNDTLKNVVISNDLEQIELKVVEQKNNN